MRWIIPLLLAATLAGCTSDSNSAPYADFESAMSAPGEVFELDGGSLKVLEPTGHVHNGNHDVYVLVFDDAGAVTDATIDLSTWMPAMEHGSTGRDPAGVGDGVYKGQADLFMPGDWELRFTVSSATVNGDATLTIAVEDAGSEHSH